MKLIVVSFYYPPDLGAGSFRLQALVQALKEVGGPDVSIEVLTTQPHRYREHAPSALPVERAGQVAVIRFPVPRSSGGMVRLAFAYQSFARQCLRHIRGSRGDVVVASASRLMPAVIGARIADRLGSRLYLDIRDLFAMNFSQLHRGIWWRPVNRVLSALEERTLRRADHLSVVSDGFLPRISAIVPEGKCSVHPNGVDEGFIVPDQPRRLESSILEVVYAGNIGRGQDLESIIPDLASSLSGRAEFTLYGDGGSRQALSAEIAKRGLSNVSLHNPVPRTELPAIYARADVLFLHLNAVDGFSATIPSKLFEYAASGRPILAGVGGVTARLISNHLENVEVFEPGVFESALRALDRLRICHTPRLEFVDRFKRSRIMQCMAREVIELGK